MTITTERAFLKRMLDLYDQLGALRQRMRDERANGNAGLQKLRRDSRQKINEIARDLRQAPSLGPFGAMITKYKFNKHQVVILLALLKRRLTRESGHMKGRDLLGLITDSSYEILRSIQLLDPNSPLISSGVVIADHGRGDAEELDTLDALFRLSERAYRLILSTFGKKTSLHVGPFKTEAKPYRNNLKLLMDYRRLALLYQKRASKVFNFEYWDDLGIGISESTTALNNQIKRFSVKIETSIEMTEDVSPLHLWAFRKEYSLDEEHLVMLVTLLFQELTEGSCYLDVVDLLKLTSKNEEDLVRRRRLFSRRNPLMRHELIIIEETMHDKPLTGEAYLPTWVAEKMLTGNITVEPGIDSDSKIRFHEFLDGLDSSDRFFEGLDDA